MNGIERARVVKSMETLVRCINAEDIILSWLMVGVADGDIDQNTSLEEIIEMGYCKDEYFSDMIECFMRCMNRAYNDGGLFCDGIVAGEKEVKDE